MPCMTVSSYPNSFPPSLALPWKIFTWHSGEIFREDSHLLCKKVVCVCVSVQCLSGPESCTASSPDFPRACSKTVSTAVYVLGTLSLHHWLRLCEENTAWGIQGGNDTCQVDNLEKKLPKCRVWFVKRLLNGDSRYLKPEAWIEPDWRCQSSRLKELRLKSEKR